MVPDLTKLGDVKARLWFLLGALVVFRIGTFIPVPGIDPVQLAQLFDQSRGTILDMFNMFSGGALERLSVFALGVMPYISASIIVQLLASAVPQLKEIKKEGESGRRRLTKYTRYGTLGLATFQSIGAAYALQKSGVAVNAGLRLHVHCDGFADHRHHVPDVARRADHRARHRQRHFDDHLRRHRRRTAARRWVQRRSWSAKAR